MDPVNSSYRIDLLTKSFSELKEQLLAQHVSAQDNNSSSGTSSGLFTSSSNEGAVRTLTEPWFNMEAVSVQLAEQLTASWHQAEPADDLALPPQNPYIPSDFELKSDNQPSAAGDGAMQQQQEQQDGILGLESLIHSWMLIDGDAAKPSVVLAQPPAMLVDEPGMQHCAGA